MSAMLAILRTGPLATVQDAGRFGTLRHGVSASGPMDVGGWTAAGALIETAGTAGIEFTSAGLALRVEDGRVLAGLAGGQFTVSINGHAREWPCRIALSAGDVLDIKPGSAGNYGYLRFSKELDLPQVLGSRATNLVVGLGGLDGRALRAGDRLRLSGQGVSVAPAPAETVDGPIRVVWGLHADLFSPEARRGLLEAEFRVTPRLDRMGVRLADDGRVFAGEQVLGLVSDAIVVGDIQILGDGQPIVLMRDHQPTGGYPRIATVISADLDRFAQMRPNSVVRFAAVTQARANALYRARFA